MMKKTVLIEIGTEELPARLLYKISVYFYQNFVNELQFYDISYKIIQSFSTPRRLALKIIEMETEDKFIVIKKRGPSVIDSYDKNGLPTEAALCWANHLGININQSTRLKTQKGEWLLYQKRQKQENIELLLPKITESALKKILIPKFMRWEIKNKKFCRPIRNIVMLLDHKIISGKIFNINSNNILQHHVSCKEEKIQIKNAQEYPLILFQKNNIIADYEIRKKQIIKKINKIAQKINGFVEINHCLLEEVNALVESPEALLATFEKKFLEIPKKILIYTIEKQQKCFPIYDLTKNLLPCFIFISNIRSNDSQKVIIGNEKVMHARLSDIEFFLKNDRKIKLENHLIFLKKVLFQNKLGSLYDKTLRLKLLIEWICKYTFSNKEDSIRAALLSKCDLVTNIVCEFPELQGTIGMYYSLENNEKKDVSTALKEQYLPSFSGDELPNTSIGCSLSIADKIDTLSGMFYIGKIPNADKDPFALRRLAIGILRIIIKKNISLDLKDLINKSLYLYDQNHIQNFKLSNKIIQFFTARLFHWYEETGHDKKVIKSVLSCNLTQPIDINQKIQAISFFKKLENSKSIILSIKRICNILKQENKIITGYINIELMNEIEEIALFNKIEKFYSDTQNLFKEKKYKKILLKSIKLEKPIYDFFKKIKIRHYNSEIRLNRLTILHKLKKIFFKITNFSYLY